MVERGAARRRTIGVRARDHALPADMRGYDRRPRHGIRSIDGTVQVISRLAVNLACVGDDTALNIADVY